MTSKYDEFWAGMLPALGRAVEAAASGRPAELDVAGVTAHGQRQSWYGKATVRGDEVPSAGMAHARALARALVAHGLTTRHPDMTFELVIDSRLRLGISATNSVTQPEPIRSRASSSRTTAATPPAAPAAGTAHLFADEACARVHALLDGLPRQKTPEDVTIADGLYFFFEDGETSAHAESGRVTRIGNHPHSDGNLGGRLRQHYRTGPGAKNASVFRRYLGGAILRDRDPGAACLEPGAGLGHLERQSARACPRCEGLERDVTQRLHDRFSFACLPVADRETRNRLEARLIATVASCGTCRPSLAWLGLAAYPPEVRKTGLWNTQHVHGPTLTDTDLDQLARAAGAVTSGTRPQGALADTLLLIPCCKGKNGTADPMLSRRSLADDLGPEGRRILAEGRDEAFSRPHTWIDKNAPLRPAIATYTGQPYTTSGVREQLASAVRQGLHCLVVSGGYGLVRVEEPIHDYEAHLQRTISVWRRRVRSILGDTSSAAASSGPSVCSPGPTPRSYRNG
jgi:hypothetical protein